MELNASDACVVETQGQWVFKLADTSDHVHSPQSQSGMDRVMDVPLVLVTFPAQAGRA